MKSALVHCIRDMGMTASETASELNKKFGLSLTRNSIIGAVHRSDLLFQSPGKPVQPVATATTQEPVQPLLPVSEKPIHPILTLRDGLCRWPIGEPRNPNFHFCLRPTTDKMIYCNEHLEMAHDRRR